MALDARTPGRVRSYGTALILGWVAFFCSPFSLSTRAEGVVISFDWGLTLAVLAAMAYGTGPALVAATAGLAALVPFLLWPGNGWANVATFSCLLAWLVGQGWAADRHRQRPSIFTHPLAVQLPIGLGYSAVVFWVFPPLLALNPAPWCTACDAEMSDAVRIAIATKTFTMLYVETSVASGLLLTAPVRRALGLEPREHGESNTRMVVFGLLAGVAFWLGATALSTVFASGTQEIPLITRGLRAPELMTLIVVTTGALMAAQGVIGLTERLKGRLKELHASEERMRRLFDNVTEAMLILSPASGKTLRVNRRARELFGSTDEELLRRAFGGLLDGGPVTSRDDILLMLGEVALSDNGDRAYNALNTSEKPFAALTSVRLVELELNKPVFVCTIKDISAQRQIERELAQTRKLEAIGRLAGGVAHDFNNMIGAIMGATDLIELESDKPEVHEMVEVIRDGSERARDLTGQLLELSRRGTHVAAPVNLHAVVDAAVTLLKRTLPPHIEIEIDLRAQRSVIEADRTQLQSALINLGVNAAHAMRTGGKLTFATQLVTTSEGEFIEIRTTDTGEGISQDHIDQIFDPFFTTKSEGEGTGLGLAAVHGTIHQAGGTIRVESELHKGTTFHIRLPLSHKEATNATKSAELSAVATGTILVIDDEPLVRRTTRKLLERAGYDVLEASDGANGLKVLETQADVVDVVLLDAVMPRMSGKECYRRIRAQWAELPVVLCSGFVREGDVEQLLGEGMKGFVRKPFSAIDLRKAIETAKSNPSRTDELQERATS